ncbi:MAG: hypothetical protein GWM92_18000 [Gemmatimonadetes bacterium]|nr:DinB family protein [Gemmatimonadota bacterium]NIR78999.1 DinB family protein [Gemmatimonadota bacterium]NIT89490.1 DinB family protein [Gemmatimonadota bacterium]NIU31510.1 DinB family protein [Gemmatimonadota bacterium]NIU36170.1 hypothetical protein [Gemmatimonadota bacterium]
MARRFRTLLAPIAAPLAAVLLLSPPASSQMLDATAFRASAIDDFQRMRGNVLQIVDAMPDSALHFMPTPGVRNFAEQIEHVVVGNVNIVASGVDADRIPLGDKSVYLNDKAELRAFVNRGFDRVREILEGMEDAELQEEGSLFGQIPTPKWKIVELAYEHGVWTMGSLVPYMRLNGVTPPSYGLVPGGGM